MTDWTYALPVAAGLSMFVGDIFQALYVDLLGEGHATWAGHADALCDMANVVSLGAGVDTVYARPVGLLAITTLAAIYVGSVYGAIVGDRASTSICRFLVRRTPAK